MRLIVGLGNPGEKYSQNRHNVGFMFLDAIADKMEEGGWKMDKMTESELYKGAIDGDQIVLAKPQTFMNESGCAVKKILSVVNGDLSHVFVAHDDLDIRLGEYKIQRGKGPKLHNGIASIEQHVGTADFMRVRIGVDNRGQEHRMPGQRYVLSNFTKDEKEILESVFTKLVAELL